MSELKDEEPTTEERAVDALEDIAHSCKRLVELFERLLEEGLPERR